MATKQDLETASDVTGVTTDRCVTRRGLMRAGVATAGAATFGGAGLQYGSDNASAQTTLEWGIGALGGAAGLAYVMHNDGIPFLGDERDYAGYTGADALHQEIYTGVTDMKVADEKVMTSISNNTTNSETVALAKGKAAIIEEMNAGNSESTAQTALDDVLNSYYTTIEKNLLTHWNTQVDQIIHMMDSAEGHNNQTIANIFEVFHSDNAHVDIGYYHTVAKFDYTHFDGTVTAVKHPVFQDDVNDNSFYRDPFGLFDEGQVSIPDMWSNGNPCITNAKAFDTSDLMEFLGGPYNATLTDLNTAYNNANQTLSGFVSDVYAEYEPDDIPTADLVDPITASTELKQNYDGYQGQGAHAAMAGIPTTAEQSVDITVHRDSGDKDLLIDIYTEHVPTDVDGNEVGFESGQRYDPSGWSEPLYISYQFTDADGNTGTDFVQLEKPFTVNSITNKNGEDVGSFKTLPRVNQTSDVTKLKEELDQLREEQIRLQEESQDDPSGGGGSLDFSNFSIGSIPGTGVVLAIVGGAAFLLGND